MEILITIKITHEKKTLDLGENLKMDMFCLFFLVSSTSVIIVEGKKKYEGIMLRDAKNCISV